MADSDGDGVSDYEEVMFALSNPLQADFNGNNTVLATINGASASDSSGYWQAVGTSLRCMNHNGFVIYNVAIANAGVYALQFTAREAIALPNGGNTQSEFMIKCYVNGVLSGTRTLTTVNNLPNSMLFYLPELSGGTANVKFVWANIADNTSLQIDSLKLIDLGGPDNNATGRADWIDNRLANLNQINAPPESKVSPLCIEGNRGIGDGVYLAVTGKLGNQVKRPWLDGIDVIWLPSELPADQTAEYSEVIPVGIPALSDSWYADVPLYPDGNTEIMILPEETTSQVTWIRTNILEESEITIRKGDSLKLAAFVDGAIAGSAVISVDGNNFNVSETEALVYKFDNPGTYTVNAEFVPSTGGAAATGTLNVKVVSATFSGAPYVVMGFEREWDNPKLPLNDTFIEYESNITLFTSAGNPGTKIVFFGAQSGDSRVLARIAKDGPILDTATLSVLDCRTHRDEGYYKLLDTFSDGSKMVEGKIILSDIPADLVIVLVIRTSGTTFLDGTIIKTLTAADFDEYGVCRYQLLKSPDSPASTCHSIEFYQGEQLLFTYKN